MGRRASETVILLNKISRLNHPERAQFFKNLTGTELNQIAEVIFNFLQGTFSIPLAGLKLLSFLKEDIRLLADIKASRKKARQLLSSTRGLFITNIIFPHALKSIQQ